MTTSASQQAWHIPATTLPRDYTYEIALANNATELAVAFLRAQTKPTNLKDFAASVGLLHTALRTAGINTAPVQAPALPAVDPKKSVSQDWITCLEDGRKCKSLRRHLKARYNLTPAEYREKWNLPDDYPMVAPSYSAQRSEMAKKIGLGRR